MPKVLMANDVVYAGVEISRQLRVVAYRQIEIPRLLIAAHVRLQ
jgi:hypothetical protein